MYVFDSDFNGVSKQYIIQTYINTFNSHQYLRKINRASTPDEYLANDQFLRDVHALYIEKIEFIDTDIESDWVKLVNYMSTLLPIIPCYIAQLLLDLDIRFIDIFVISDPDFYFDYIIKSSNNITKNICYNDSLIPYYDTIFEKIVNTTTIPELRFYRCVCLYEKSKNTSDPYLLKLCGMFHMIE